MGNQQDTRRLGSEASRTVTSYGRYPFTRNVTFGLNLTF